MNYVGYKCLSDILNNTKEKIYNTDDIFWAEERIIGQHGIKVANSYNIIISEERGECIYV